MGAVVAAVSTPLAAVALIATPIVLIFVAPRLGSIDSIDGPHNQNIVQRDFIAVLAPQNTAYNPNFAVAGVSPYLPMSKTVTMRLRATAVEDLPSEEDVRAFMAVGMGKGVPSEEEMKRFLGDGAATILIGGIGEFRTAEPSSMVTVTSSAAVVECTGL
ncbi:hypothetical protein AUEXF2481DRAFT_37922 [Aureobasidium subglaciale EXF-2481]|uniref:Uncharacterized protein n=1 Tax=Aureobasidium subglaciale (strain EXF-2481) TaxID=1043005 RepID=A0A074YI67_AURSE|nr:uncharacterized protein AUEXF2481DRAFT_37922 [Aureobasidium subglaciale EXF-2481]KAI5205990.1 hypothetical protein E4T38_04112 [Aureobasidium subglaciale]KAI5224788.1 hypothetical protein E4T40_03887 [Aureobasidium subglaciale]KAI5228007.1 hypothetical protein E4T41_04107 [Aureobasidium subglaciale]KAI5263524.1 hypothetical protein E4T46_03728 [Aureobasidium subglaciale]KEQ97405.1 hypothetical protein AUEXF2481DRAFT_37922 [Aureobasidium subglaciale EXF-2481]